MVNDDPSDDEFIPSPNIYPGILEPQRSVCRSLARVCHRTHAFRYNQVDDPLVAWLYPHFLAPLSYIASAPDNCIDLCSGSNFNTLNTFPRSGQVNPVPEFLDGGAFLLDSILGVPHWLQ